MRTLPQVSPAMLDGLLWFYENRNWNEVRTGTSAALVGRKLVGHSRIGIKPDLIEDDGVAVLLAHGRLVHEVGDTVREARRDGVVGTVTEVHPNHIVTTVGAGGVAAYLPVSKLPAVWRETTDEETGAELAEVVPDSADAPQAAQLSGLEQLHTDRALVRLMQSAPGENVRRRRAELLLQLPTPAERVKAVAQAHDASTQLGGPDLAVALSDIVATHPSWRPVSCGGRYLPCRFDDGSPDYGVWDTEAEVWLEIGGAGVTRWSSFEYANADAVKMSGLAEQVLAQTSYAMSVVRPGDRIEGTCVTYGTTKRGVVVGVTGPVRSPDCGGYRYRIRDEDGRRPIVFAQRWI
jgi:hypothetical protein